MRISHPRRSNDAPNLFIVFNVARAMLRAKSCRSSVQELRFSVHELPLINPKTCRSSIQELRFLAEALCLILLPGIASAQRRPSLTLLGCGFHHRRQPSPAQFLTRLLLRVPGRPPRRGWTPVRGLPRRRIPRKPISRRRATSTPLRRRSIPVPIVPTARRASRACTARWSVRFAAFI